MGYNGYSKKFDIEKFKPDKIVIATDADPDGDHIRCLVLGLFLRYLPEAIERGYIYSATPPLYGISLGKNKMKFFANNIDYIEYVQSLFCKENEICSARTKKALSKKDITKIIYNNIDYVKIMNHVSLTYAIDPYLLEFILYNRNLTYAKFKSVVEKAYKFCKVTNENSTTMIRGLVGSAYQTVFFNQRLINDCRDIISLIDKSEEYYIINGTKCTLYQLMVLFNSFEPKNLTRYKGLGEMRPQDLSISTVLPGMGRTLRQYTINDAKKELQVITDLQSDKSAFIKGIKVKKEDIV